ncbi:hypothetical protein ABW20_dc0107335 [Dactylellina cionopaga]|nr:hypothetical protein ABW20_dc0107335 [Dactylellina cionopaga]
MSTYPNEDDDVMEYDKGKGKAQETNVVEEEGDEESSDEETDNALVEDDDDLSEIDSNNILPPGRIRSKASVDYTKVHESDLPEDEDEDDDDFEDDTLTVEVDEGDKMEH